MYNKNDHLAKWSIFVTHLIIQPLSPLDPRRHLHMLYICIATFNCPKGILGLGGGKASKNKLKDASFIFSMTNVTILSIFRTHAQKEYCRVLEMKDTYILNILALLLFENLLRIYLNYRLNGTQSKDVKWGVVVEGASFNGFVNDGSLWNLFWCVLCIFYYRHSPILKILGQFENEGFEIMSTRENMRLIARSPLLSLESYLLITKID